MAKKGIKENSLFNGHRRKMKLKGGVLVFLDPQGNLHSRLQVSLPLLNESVLGMPDFISSCYASMQKEASAERGTDYDRYMQGMSMAFFNGDKGKTKQLRLTGCELDKFSIQRSGQGESTDISLHFQIDVLGNKELYDFMWEHHNAPVHVEFDYNQNDIRFPENDEDESEEKTNASTATKTAAKKSAGPTLM